MSGRRAFITVLVSLLVIAGLVAAGVCLYRLGFARGLAAATGLPVAGPFMHPDVYGMPGFSDGRLPVWCHGGGMFYGGHWPIGMFGFGGWFVGLLVLVGFVALIVAAIKALTPRHPVEVQPAPLPAAPPPPEPAPARPTRRTGGTRTPKR